MNAEGFKQLRQEHAEVYFVISHVMFSIRVSTRVELMLYLDSASGMAGLLS